MKAGLTEKESARKKLSGNRVVVWGKLAETCGKHLTKGRQVFVDGRLQTRSWETEQGQKRFTTEIVANQVLFLGRSAQGVGKRGYGCNRCFFF